MTRKPRHALTAAETAELHDRIDRLLDRAGLETQPRVAVRILDLVGREDAQLKDYQEAIRADAAITGRLLRLANSAAFAQRSPVTRIERALVLLGIERVKAVSLGFYLSRAAASAGARAISRAVWGQSVFRACLCAALVRAARPSLASEAFVVGLMLDSGVPLAARLVGEAYERVYAAAGGDGAEGVSPALLFKMERESLEYTHVDVAAVLCRRWRLPPTLSKPIAWHHAPPADAPAPDDAGDAVSLLHRAAYCAGAVRVGIAGVSEPRTPASLGARALGLTGEQAAAAVRSAAREHAAIAGLFAGVAGEVEDLDALADRVARQLADELDRQLIRSLRRETGPAPSRLSIGGFEVELQPRERGQVEVFIDTPSGERLMACTVNAGTESAATLQRSLGLEDATEDELRLLVTEIRAMAA